MKTKAFTIVELLVAVAIIALLSGIVIANLSTSKSRSRDAKRISDINQIQLALELFFDRCDRYPVAVSGLPNANESTNGCPSGITFESFISRIPTPPTTGDYYYIVNHSTTPTDYVLRAKLESNNQVLLDDVDDPSSRPSWWPAVSTFTCADATYNYCIQPR